MVAWTVPPIWADGECWIIGGGTSVPRQFGVPEETIQDVMKGRQQPSAFSEYLAPIHDKHIIAINNAYKLGSWIDVLFFGDCGWYNVYRIALQSLTCLKITSCDRFVNYKEKELQSIGIKYLPRDRKKSQGISNDPSKVCWNNNSGLAAISVAVHFGVKRIILLGFDMTLDENKVSHWHGSHHPQDKKPTPPPFARHMVGLQAIADDARSLGVEILNASPISTITQFPKVNVKDLLYTDFLYDEFQ